MQDNRAPFGSWQDDSSANCPCGEPACHRDTTGAGLQQERRSAERHGPEYDGLHYHDRASKCRPWQQYSRGILSGQVL